MVNRNDTCPCGSGRKYKKCCINNNSSPIELWKERALLLGIENPDNEKIVSTFFAVFNYSLQKNWTGACHAVSSIIFILLKVQGIDSIIKLGFVKAPAISYPFSHSWVTIGEENYDIGLYRSNNPKGNYLVHVEVSAPIFKGIDLETNKPTVISYDVTTSREPSDRTYKNLSEVTMGEYMKGWTLHKDGLWGETYEIAKILNLNVNIQDLKQKYSNNLYSDKKS